MYNLNLSEEFIPVGKKNRPGTKISPSFITVHNTDNSSKGADAKAHSGFVRNTGYYMWKGEKKWVSWHFTVDDHEAIKHLPLNEAGYHAGSGNGKSVAIEQCMNSDMDVAAADERLCQLLAVLCNDLSITSDKIVKHQHWTGKKCPSVLMAKWDGIVDRVNHIIKTESGNLQTTLGVNESTSMFSHELSTEEVSNVEEFDIEEGVVFDLSPQMS